jgi:two-component system sensor histidine kinase KdpD
MTRPVHRNRAEDFLELVERGRRGKLKLYIGFAAGVGKTYRMLEEAHALKKRGTDVVVGFVETHGRTETAALIEGLEVIPRKDYSYRNVTVEEMDLDGVLERNPSVAIVDELAHTNVPLAPNRKRYQDVLDLLNGGINVIGALNVQHLESLNDLVERTTGVRVRETVPDSFLKEADQIVNLDLSVEDLHHRLIAGKIYKPDKVESALQGFFRPENLFTLRELALREVAESLERAAVAAAPTAPRDESAQRGTQNRVMVCMSSYPPRAAQLLRRGSRLAGRLNTDWFVVYVQTPREAPHLIDATAQRHLLDNIERARELGAEVVRLQSDEPVDALLNFARSHGVGLLLVGRSHQARWKQWLRMGMDQKLVREADGLDVQVVSLEESEERP